jgi:hypothetical protein
MMNETDGIEFDIDNYMKQHAKQGWDDIHFSAAAADDDDGPASQTAPSRKKQAAILLAAIASFGAIIGLGYAIGYGIGGSIGNNSNNVMSSNMNAVTLEDCMEYSSSGIIPTYSPTYYPTSGPVSEEEQVVALFFPVFSNDIPIITDDDEKTTTQEVDDGGEDGNDSDGPVRRLGLPRVEHLVMSRLPREEESDQRVSEKELFV